MYRVTQVTSAGCVEPLEHRIDHAEYSEHESVVRRSTSVFQVNISADTSSLWASTQSQCVGIGEAATLVPLHEPDAIIYDYDLLATISLADSGAGPRRRCCARDRRQPHSASGRSHLLDINGIAGFLYLPTLDREDARRLLAAIRPSVPN